ncbi:hypothetical protein [Bradyrhizobium sp. CCGB01]|uniref:hypothetical protein n=1 Tax=Bradyrhizobium sp. CCGB01 TaxID=2949634 RepID=UPI0020B3A960|nr:hypothetical protein [Bradyrhizobium sp. CCGB01]MCP3409229.1 hypothetical protein [Bradyrhizobium sp. CCGB01]
MTALSSYSTGTVTVSAGGTTVTGTGTIWSDGSAKPGDLLQIGNFQSVISDVTDATHLVIPPWGGGAQTGVAYKIWQVSPQRFAGAEVMGTVNKLVTAFNTSGFFVFVDVDATDPDPSLGDDGQYAFQPTTGKTWVKSAGVWTYLGIYKAFNLRGAYDNVTTYSYGDVQTTSGSSYIYINDTPSAGHAAPNATYWNVLASKGADGVDGDAATISVGTVTTVAYGNPATVTNSGTPSATVFDFEIPAGQDGAGTVADPTATIGLTAVNGSASSAIRSDGAPALSQSIAPSWTGLHSFNAFPVKIGSPANAQSDPAISITRAFDNTGSGDGHGVSDGTAISRTTGGPIGYASFDGRVTLSGTGNFDHYAAIQSLPTFSQAGTVSRYWATAVDGAANSCRDGD